MVTPSKDVLICHASEDKEAIVRPLFEALTEAGISCWYDEAEIKWGDSIPRKVNEGLRISRFVLLILSLNSVQKNWPQSEMYSVLNQEVSGGKIRILPLLVGTDKDVEEILRLFPLLNGKLYLRWDDDVNKVVNAMLARLGRSQKAKIQSSESVLYPDFQIPIPKMKKTFSQRDKDLFLGKSFDIIKEYFRVGLEKMESHCEDIDTDLQEIHKTKFTATIYLKGETAERCKVWIANAGSGPSIGYYSGRWIWDSDTSFNDSLTVTDNGGILVLTTFGMWSGQPEYLQKEHLSPEEASEYLWRRFTEYIGLR